MGLRTSLLLIAGGAVLIGLSVWRRRGRGGGRSWAKDEFNRHGYLFVYPGAGLIMVGVGLGGLGENIDLSLLIVVGVLCGWVGVLIIWWGATSTVLPLPVPGWYLPVWLRPVVAAERAEARARRVAKREARRARRARRARCRRRGVR